MALEHRLGRHRVAPLKSGAAASTEEGQPPAGPGVIDAINLHYRWIILIGLITASVMEVLDTTIVNVALPQMAGNLNATTDEIAWVSTGYILSNVIVLPMTAWLSRRFGRKNYLTFSILLFVTASFFCGTSRTLIELVVWRIIQGGGGAALLSTAQATLRQVFPRNQQGLVQTIFILGIVVAPTVGPTLGGWITDNYYWPWVFFINVPIGLISASLVYLFLHDTHESNKAGSIDYFGMILLTVGLGSLQYVLEEGERNDWFASATIERLTLIAVVALAVLIFWELSPRNKHPIIEFHVLKNRTLTGGVLLFLALGFGLYGGIFIFPLFTQDVLGFSPLVTGLTLLPGGIATAVGAVLCGRLLNGKKKTVDSRFLILIGFLLFIWSMWDLGHLSIMSGVPDTRNALIIRGLALGFLFTPINQTVFGALHGKEIPQGSSFVNLARQLGGSFGIAGLNTYVTNMTHFHRFYLVLNLTSGNTLLLQRQRAVAANLVAHGYSAVVAKMAALGVIDHMVQAQASVMAYNDGFLLIGISFVIAAPAILLLRVSKSAGGAAAGGH